MRFRPRSLRFKIVVAILGVLILPQTLVLLSELPESDAEEKLRQRTQRAAERADRSDSMDTLAAEHDAQSEAIDTLAAEHGVWIRIATLNGRIIAESNHGGHDGLWFQIGSFFFGPDGAPSLIQLEETLPPLMERPEVITALSGGIAHGCHHFLERKLLACHSVLRTDDQPPRVIHVQASSRRAIRALFDLRYQILKLTLFLLPLGLGLSLWLGWRLARPVEHLRREVMTRAHHAIGDATIELDRSDEVGDLAVAFNSLLAALRQRGQQNEAFLADLAHELKNPVAAIRASAESLTVKGDSERTTRLGAVMLKSCSRLDQLISEFLELARAEAGLPNEQREEVDLANLARGLVSALELEQNHHQVSFDIRGPAHLVVRGVARRLEMALRNLIDNAASFAGPAGRVEIHWRSEKSWAVVHVADSGPGIPAEERSHVFERFYTTRGERRGTGLGLALVKAIVEAHDGQITASSSNLGGAELILRMPLFTQFSPAVDERDTHT